MAYGPAPPSVVARWKELLAQRTRWIASHPADLDVPYWQSQAKILTYLLARYGTDRGLPSAARAERPAPIIRPGGTRAAAVHSRVRSPQEIQRLLARIVDANTYTPREETKPTWYRPLWAADPETDDPL